MMNDKGTFGVLMNENIPICCTVELPWKENKNDISCIPTGTYGLAEHNGPKFKNVWELLHVPVRDAVLIHWGNTIRDTKGCIIVGRGFGIFDGLPGVTDSYSTIERLRGIMKKHSAIRILNAVV